MLVLSFADKPQAGPKKAQNVPGSTVITAVRLSPTVGMDACPIVYLKLVGEESRACTTADPSSAKTDPNSSSLLSDSFAISCNTPINKVGIPQNLPVAALPLQWTVDLAVMTVVFIRHFLSASSRT